MICILGNYDVPINPAEEFVEWQQAETDLHHCLQESSATMSTVQLSSGGGQSLMGWPL